MPKTPFIRVREVMMGDSSTVPMEQGLSPLSDETRSVTPEIFRRYSPENWDLPKLKRYIDMLKAFGYNAVQFTDSWESYLDAGWGADPNGQWPKAWVNGAKVDPRDWPAKCDAMADYARSIGMRASFFFWGNAGFDYRTNELYWALCPNKPSDRVILEQYWDHCAAHAPHYDHFITHWGDPGGCKENGCTIETAERIHADLLGRFRKLNPRIESSFSLWMLSDERFGRWAGYKGVESLAKGGILPDDVMFCVHAEHKKFDEKELREIVRCGRRAGMWTWYLVNNEIIPSMYSRTQALKEFFDALPADATDLIAWQSIDNNNHLLNQHSLYVTARLMIDRTTDPKAAQREFLAGVLGEKNATAAARALEIIEILRPMWGYKYGDEPLDASLAREAEDAARKVKVARGFEPAWPMPVSPAEYAEEILKQTEALREFAEFSVAAARVEKEKSQAALDALPIVTRPTKWMTNLEYVRRLARIEAIRTGWGSMVLPHTSSPDRE